MSEDKGPSLVKQALSLVLDFVPFVGSGKSALEVFSGKDPITGEHINRWLAAGGIVLGFIPFGKLLTKGKPVAGVIDEIAAKIVYDAPSKEALIKKMEQAVAGVGRDVDHSFIMQQIKKIDPRKLEKKFGIHYNPLDSRSDMNLVGQYLVQMQEGGHAVYKHWFGGGKKRLLSYLSEAERKHIQAELTDADEAVEYLKFILKDRKTVKIHLPHSNCIGFANKEKKVLIIHNPTAQGTFYASDDPIQALHEIYGKELSR